MIVKISVVVPIYNSEEYLRRCVQSLLKQSMTSMEYIFIDDCSTDNSMAVLRDALADYPNIQRQIKIIQHNKNKGSAAARNSGLRNAVGEYIGWVDSDDWIEVDMFKNMYHAAKYNDADIVWTDFYNTYIGYEDRIVQQSFLDSERIIKAFLEGDLLGGMCNKLIRRGLFDDYSIKFPDGLNMCEDLRVCIALFFYSQRFVYLDIAPYHYIKHKEDSISSTNSRLSNINKEWIGNVKGIEQFLREKGLEEKMRTSLMKLKLSSKKNLLINGRNIKSYKRWSRVFPESNSYVWKTNLPIYYKFVAFFANHNIWPLVYLWVLIKYKILCRK